jgi:hypothetical protein
VRILYQYRSSEKTAPGPPWWLPVLIKGVFLPWKGQIIWDGLFTIYNLSLETGIRNSLWESYRQAKAADIITSLDPNRKAEKPVAAKKPKTPAIWISIFDFELFIGDRV